MRKEYTSTKEVYFDVQKIIKFESQVYFNTFFLSCQQFKKNIKQRHGKYSRRGTFNFSVYLAPFCKGERAICGEGIFFSIPLLTSFASPFARGTSSSSILHLVALTAQLFHRCKPLPLQEHDYSTYNISLLHSTAPPYH